MLYSVVLAAAAVAPWALGLTGAIYGLSATVLNVVFVVLAIRVWRNEATEAAQMRPEKRLFGFSILYLFILFGALVADRLLIA
jgi:protoheme IX farnesyltransferase